MHVGTFSQRGVLETVAGKLRYREQICDRTSDWFMHRWFGTVHCRWSCWETHRCALRKCACIAAIVKFTTKKREVIMRMMSCSTKETSQHCENPIHMQSHLEIINRPLVPAKGAGAWLPSEGFVFTFRSAENCCLASFITGLWVCSYGPVQGVAVTEHWMRLPTSDDKR